MAPVTAASPPILAAFFKFLPVAIFLALFPNPRALRLNPANPDRPRAPRVKAPNLGPTLRNTRGNDLRRAPNPAPICCCFVRRLYFIRFCRFRDLFRRLLIVLIA